MRYKNLVLDKLDQLENLFRGLDQSYKLAKSNEEIINYYNRIREKVDEIRTHINVNDEQ